MKTIKLSDFYPYDRNKGGIIEKGNLISFVIQK